jgi:hypothetical protein
MTSISRRTLIGAMAALPATAGPGRARSAAGTQSSIQALIQTHRAAHALYEEAGKLYSQAEAVYDQTRPENLVPLPFGRGSVDYQPFGSRNNQIQSEFGVTRNCLKVMRRVAGDALADSIEAIIRAEEDRMVQILKDAEAREEAFCQSSGYAEARDRFDRAADAEYDALTALIRAAPADLFEAGMKAAYFATVVDNVGAERQQEMLASLVCGGEVLS